MRDTAVVRQYYGSVIRSFASRDTERLWNGEEPEKLPEVIQRTAYRKLLMIDSAGSLFVLSKLGGNRLEKLRGDRTGQYSIRINDQWRICFCWEGTDAVAVEIVDYH